MTQHNIDSLKLTPLWAAYPERVLDPRADYNGSLILSRWPITDGGSLDVAGVPMAQATVHTPGGPVRLVDVHLIAPVSAGNLPFWKAQLTEMAGWNTGQPLILAGDWNSTADHASFQKVLKSGLRDAFEEAGSGFGFTWPQWSGPMWPVMRLDHVLVSQQFTVVSVDEQANPGSDHRRLKVELALPRSG